MLDLAQHDEEIDSFDEPEEDERTAVVHLGDLKRSSLPARPDRHIIVRMDSANVGQVFALDSEEWTLGRHTQSTIVLTDDGVSRKHARIVRQGDRYVLEDQGSANGTFVRGEKVDRHVLTDGDVFQLGPTVMFRYTYTDASQERMLNKLYEASVRDALTGTYNREHFEERLKVEVAYARRHNTVVSLVMFDLDHFKKINDNYGHPAGDAALIYVSQRVQKGLRTEDVFARYGGEEFAVILRGIDLEGSRRVGERLRSTVAATPVEFDGKTFPVTMSVGCATLSDCPEPSTTALVAIADRRLYAAKHGGRNRVVAEG
ncbi:MAG: diguanylate cyclase [Polyangiaceae bacterium]|nr:diguanylate cyclase [Polyangiaceae bacterium]MCE7893587.1 diguanylate cyclase [Sorangiineae bacterium PRO1]MCL4751730.1 diguanylate cyclase [Myxococcales bacterium]